MTMIGLRLTTELQHWIQLSFSASIPYEREQFDRTQIDVFLDYLLNSSMIMMP